MAFLRDRSVFCIPNGTLSVDERYIIGSICMSTSSVGFLGAALQLKSLWPYRDRQRRAPSVNPRIILYLALVDLVACLGIFMLAICLMVFELPKRQPKHYIAVHNDLYTSVGTPIEILTLFAYMASYIWTFVYALDMCFQIHRIECSMTVYHVLAWLIPLEFVTIIEVVNFVKYPSYCEGCSGRKSRLYLSYLPVMAVMIANPVLFIITYRKVKQCLRSSGRFAVEERNALERCKTKLFLMVFVFTICWFPNIISVSYDLATYKRCQTKKSTVDYLWFLEAFVNPLQGIFNYFVYRNTFRVTAFDMRSLRNSYLPRGSRNFSNWEDGHRYNQNRIPTLDRESVQRSENFSSPADEETTLLGSSRSNEPSEYVYVSRLLGGK